MQINLHNAKAEAGLRNMQFFNSGALWEEYLEENQHLRSLMLASPEDRFTDGKQAVDVFRDAVEYIPRSLIGRPLQTYLVRKLMHVLNEEKKYRVLDYGCGAGNVGFMFAQLGFQTTLVEVNGVITDFLRWRIDKAHLPITLLTEDEPLEKYDLVTLFNVLEHLQEPLHVLQRIHASLLENGYLAMLFNTHEHGLDIVSHDTWERILKPFLLAHFTVVIDTDQMLYQKFQ